MRRLFLAVGALALGACTSGGGSTGGGSDEAGDTQEIASMEFALSPLPDFAKNSVLICGLRERPVDSKYPCDDGYLPDGTVKKVCECFEFDSAGALLPKDGLTGLRNLCPTKDYPQGTWDFDYTIYSKVGCDKGGGAIITSPDPKQACDNNFVCYDAQNLATRFHPNMTLDEDLKPGANCNDVTCITQNASKQFEFDVCVDVTNQYHETCNLTLDAACTRTCPPDTVCPPPAETIVLDCGCVHDPLKGCQCGQDIIDKSATLLPPGCSFTYGCNVKCVRPPL